MDKNDVKFACLCARLSPNVRLPSTSLGEGFHVERPWAEISIDTWRDVLGKYACREIERANLWIWVVEPSSELNVNNTENRRLQERILNFWMSLLLHETPEIQTAWALTGSLMNAKADVHSLEKYPQPRRHALCRRLVLTTGDLSSVARIAAILETGYREQLIGGRLDRGLTALISGKLSGEIDEGILCFERALEGILHPANCRQFSSRARRIIGDASESNGVSDLLSAIYDARSGFTHALPLSGVFPGLDDARAVRRGRELQAATYHLASRSYLAALSDPALIRLFSGEQLGEYWGRVVVGKKSPPFTISLLPSEYTISESDDEPNGDDG